MALHQRIAAKGALFYALEAVRAMLVNGASIAERALALSSSWRDADFELLRARLQKVLGRDPQ
jgi:hypothetical protein